MIFSIHLMHYDAGDFGLFTIAYKDKWQWSLLRITFTAEVGEVSWFTLTLKNESK